MAYTFVYTDERHRLRYTRDGVDASVEGCQVTCDQSLAAFMPSAARGQRYTFHGGDKTAAFYNYNSHGSRTQVHAVTVNGYGQVAATIVYYPRLDEEPAHCVEFLGRVYNIGFTKITDALSGVVLRQLDRKNDLMRDAHVEAADGNMYFASIFSQDEFVIAHFNESRWQAINMSIDQDNLILARLCQGSSGLIYARYGTDMWSRDVRAPTPEVKLRDDDRLVSVHWANVGETIVVHSAYAREPTPALMYDERNNDFCGTPFLMTASMVPIWTTHTAIAAAIVDCG